MLRSWTARHVVGRAYRGLGEGDPSAALAAFGRNGRFRFAGNHSFTADTTEPSERRAWFERFAALKPHMQIRDVLAAGRLGGCG